MKSKKTLGIVTVILFAIAGILGLTSCFINRGSIAEIVLGVALSAGTLGLIAFTGWILALVITAIKESANNKI